MKIEDISRRQRRAAKKVGRAWWFEAGAIRFFDTKIESEVYSHPAYSGHYFVTSEQCHHSDGSSDKRLYSVRCWDEHVPAEIETIGKFQQYRTLQAAQHVARMHSMGLAVFINTDHD